jgi:hypothetical protein
MRTRIIVQDKDSLQYLSAEDAWAGSFQQAKVFEHTHCALFEGLRHLNKRLQIVWCFNDDLRNSIYIPIHSDSQ